MEKQINFDRKVKGLSMNALTLFNLFGVVEIDFVPKLFYERLEQLIRQRVLHLAFADKAKELIANL